MSVVKRGVYRRSLHIYIYGQKRASEIYSICSPKICLIQPNDASRLTRRDQVSTAKSTAPPFFLIHAGQKEGGGGKDEFFFLEGVGM